MEIKLKIVDENPDGSANAVVTFDAEGLEVLVDAGIKHILLEYIKQKKEQQNATKKRKPRS